MLDKGELEYELTGFMLSEGKFNPLQESVNVMKKQKRGVLKKQESGTDHRATLMLLTLE